MRGVLVLALALEACTYHPTPNDDPGTAVDAAPGVDSAIGSDGGADADTRTWVVIETLTIPVANGAQVTSQMSLAMGITYHLQAHGTYVIDNSMGTLGDAEYYDFAQQTPYDITPIG